MDAVERSRCAQLRDQLAAARAEGEQLRYRPALRVLYH
jgi:hypothetical protein